MSEKTDFKVTAVLDRDALVEDITSLVGILKRQKVYCIIRAGSLEEAVEEAKTYLWQHQGVLPNYVKAYHPRRLPT